MFRKYLWQILAISFSLGIVVANYFLENLKNYPVFFFSIFLLFFLLVLVISKIKNENKKTKLILIFLFISFLFLGLWRYLISWPEINSSNISFYKNNNLKIIGKVYDEIEFKNNKQRIKIEVLFLNNQTVSGNVLIITNQYPVYEYGQILEINSLFVEGGKIENFNYGLYLKRHNISLLAYYPEINIINNYEIKINFFKKIIFNFKDGVRNIFDKYLSISSAAMAKALLIDDKSELSPESMENFSKTGLSHIVAISGMHISLFSSMLINFFLLIGLARKKAFYLVIIFLIVYLIIIGVPASAFRAVLMGSLYLISVHLGRKSDASNLLFFSALVLLLINPFLLLADLGFQLSFLAILGIIYFQEKIKICFLKIFFLKNNKKIIKAIFETLAITISAQITTAPILFYNFNQISWIAPISNLFVLWTLPLILISLIISLIISCFLPFMSPLIFLIPEILLSYIYFIANIFS